MVGTADYQLDKYIDTLIKPNINCNLTVDSTSGFVKKLEDFQFSDSDKCVSFVCMQLFLLMEL